MPTNIDYWKINEQVIKSLPTPVVVIDDKYTVILINEGFKNIFAKANNVVRRSVKLKTVLKPNEELFERIVETINGENNPFMYIVDNQFYLVTITEINEDNINNYVIMLNNVTKQEEEQQTRKKFISMVAHELRTPLAAISSHAELVAYHDKIEKEEMRNMAKTIYSETQRLSKMVSELLDISKYDQMAIKLNKESFNIKDLIENIEYLYTAKDARDDVEISFSSIDLEVYADYDKLEQILINLIENAYVYTNSYVKVSVAQKNNKIRLIVVDDGVGMTLEQKEKIFNRFYRADDSRNRNSGGTGLGLSIVKEITELHNGNIYVHSKKNEGAEFIVEIPINS